MVNFDNNLTKLCASCTGCWKLGYECFKGVEECEGYIENKCTDYEDWMACWGRHNLKKGTKEDLKKKEEWVKRAFYIKKEYERAYNRQQCAKTPQELEKRKKELEKIFKLREQNKKFNRQKKEQSEKALFCVKQFMEGKSTVQIAKENKIPYNSVYNYIHCYIKNNKLKGGI